MNILVIGNGGREHAICRTLKKSELVNNIYCAPGNAGMKKDDIKCINYDDFSDLINFCKCNDIIYTIVGPEQPLSEGIVDCFKKSGLKIFGPNEQQSQLEASKSYAKKFMEENNIPTAKYKTFDDYYLAKKYIEEKNKLDFPIVIKADGLAAGKGVVICSTKLEALDTIEEMMVKNKFNKSGKKVVIEDFLEGEEFSLLAFVENENFYPMPVAQDHKRALDGDRGLNTGGMGAYCPVTHISDTVINEAVEKILKPTVNALKNYVGILYCGLISTSDGVKVIEYNVRFGDPEVQVILPRLESDLAENILDMLNGKQTNFIWKKTGVNLGVVIAAKGYPQSYIKGVDMSDFDNIAANVIYANVIEKDNKLISNGGRILLLETYQKDIEECQKFIYGELKKINNDNIFYRHDIGNKGKGEINKC